MSIIQKTAYIASSDLAKEKGVFPLYDGAKHLASPEIDRLPEKVVKAIKKNGLRNGLLTSIAPTGTISLLAGNVSGGIEPIFDLSYQRTLRDKNGGSRAEHIEDYAYGLLKQVKGDDLDLLDSFRTVTDLTPSDHLAMQAALQPFVDSAISKTINCPKDISFDAFSSIYADAYQRGLKGCTTYRPNKITGVLLQSDHEETLERVSVGADRGMEAVDPVLTGLEPALPLPSIEGVQKSSVDRLASKSGIVYLSDPMERGATLAGYTYKLRWPDSEHATYITINDVILNERRRPFEIFINTKNLEHYAWTVALTRMISAVFRRGGDISFVVEELKAVFDPRGGQWMNGHYVPSLLAAIGEVVEKHLQDTGFSPAQSKEGREDDKQWEGRSEGGERGLKPCKMDWLAIVQSARNQLWFFKRVVTIANSVAIQNAVENGNTSV